MLAIGSDPTTGDQQVDMGVNPTWPFQVWSTDRIPGSLARRRLWAQRSLTAVAETCISRPHNNFWLQRNAARNSEGTVTMA